MSDFQKKYGPWALITGANAGIGRAIANELAARKLNIVAVARRQRFLDSLKEELEEKHGVEVCTLSIDLTEPDAIDKIDRATQDLVIGLIVPAAGGAVAEEI